MIATVCPRRAALVGSSIDQLSAVSTAKLARVFLGVCLGPLFGGTFNDDDSLRTNLRHQYGCTSRRPICVTWQYSKQHTREVKKTSGHVCIDSEVIREVGAFAMC